VCYINWLALPKKVLRHPSMIGVEEVRFMDPLTEEEDAYTQRTDNYFPLQEYLNF
jgi:hypothetical protein